ncbi:MAG: hypothetical protein H6722_25155 [Sandaracinus sp.]|nr:hypothetical protein [Sandaracinus sp.]
MSEITRLNAVVRRDLRPVVVQFLSGFQVPDALVRKKLGEVRGGIRPDVINAVVTDSLRVRAAQTAIDWWHKPHYDSSTHGTLDEALARVESSLGTPGPGAATPLREGAPAGRRSAPLTRSPAGATQRSRASRGYDAQRGAAQALGSAAFQSASKGASSSRPIAGCS